MCVCVCVCVSLQRVSALFCVSFFKIQNSENNESLIRSFPRVFYI